MKDLANKSKRSLVIIMYAVLRNSGIIFSCSISYSVFEDVGNNSIEDFSLKDLPYWIDCFPYYGVEWLVKSSSTHFSSSYL